MQEYRGGQKAQKGVYLNRNDGELVQLYGETRVLPGSAELRYMKVPGALAVLGAPIAGFLFVFFLPTIGFIGTLALAAVRIRRGMAAAGRKAS